MRKIVAFSGGFDSTLTLANLVREAYFDDEILAVTCVHHSTGDVKLAKEKEARDNIINKLKTLYPLVTLNSAEIEIQVDSSLYPGNSEGLSQPILWICSLIPFIQPGAEVYLGYISSDQAIGYLDSIKNMWRSSLEIQNCKKVELKLPLRYYSKEEVLGCLMVQYPKLIDLCVSCDSLYDPKKFCGNCSPCRHLKSALVGLLLNSADSFIHDKAEIMLRTKFNLNVSITKEGMIK